MATRKHFVRLTATHPLVEELKSDKHEWWTRLVNLSLKDREINIQVRGDYVSVYSRMGSLLKIFLSKQKKLACSIHYKYLIGSRRKEYINVIPSGSDLTVSLQSCDLVRSILEKENFDLIKSNIRALGGEEKKIQSKLVESNRKTLIDAEIAFTESGILIDDPEDEYGSDRGKTRIDLVNYDERRKALVFIELKQIFDGRLYSDSKGRKEVNRQIEKYKAFAKNHAEELIKTYNDVIEVKRRLGLLPNGSVLKTAKIEYVEPKPILAIAAYDQNIIDAKKDKVLKGLNTDNLAALYFFGSSLDLNLAKKKNGKLFI
jgi:hypothetical protein